MVTNFCMHFVSRGSRKHERITLWVGLVKTIRHNMFDVPNSHLWLFIGFYRNLEATAPFFDGYQLISSSTNYNLSFLKAVIRIVKKSCMVYTCNKSYTCVQNGSKWGFFFVIIILIIYKIVFFNLAILVLLEYRKEKNKTLYSTQCI